MQLIRIYARGGGLVAAFRPAFQDERDYQRRYPEGEYLWLR